MPKNGFSLVELLITISIIAVLSALGLIVYTAVLQQGRDSKRQSDLRSIQSALEQYNSDQGFYPTTLNFGESNNLTSETGNPDPPSVDKIYMNKVPNDSNTTFPYQYTALRDESACDNTTIATQCNKYCLFAKLDTPPSPAITLPLGCSFTFGSNIYNFALTPP